MYKLIYSKHAYNDAKKIAKSNLQSKVIKLLEVIEKDPWATYPAFKSLGGDLEGHYSRRINIQHRLVYEVDQESKRIKVLRMWSHYGDN